MYRAVARIRTSIALLLLVTGQLAAAAAAQATCPRAALRRAAVAARSTTPTSSAAVLVSEHHHHTSAPVGDHAAAPSTSCGATIALLERAIESFPPIPPMEDVPARVTSPPGDPFASSFFRPPRLS